MNTIEARNKAKRMFSLTKGKRVYKIKDNVEIQSDQIDEIQINDKKTYSGYEALKMAAVHGKSVTELFGKPKWEGGTESAMFNRLEEIAGKFLFMYL